jgi:hypothetical protein
MYIGVYSTAFQIPIRVCGEAYHGGPAARMSSSVSQVREPQRRDYCCQGIWLGLLESWREAVDFSELVELMEHSY